MIWKPTFTIITREGADEYVIHRVSEDGQQLASARIPSMIYLADLLEPGTSTTERRLAPWIAWMEKVDFENLWHDDV